MTNFAAKRPDTFDSLKVAQQHVLETPFLHQWDPRVVQRYCEIAFRSGPTVLHPQSYITTTLTGKYSKSTSLVRPNPDGRGAVTHSPPDDRFSHPDVDPAATLKRPVYQPATRHSYNVPPSLRPPALYVLGKGSQVVPAHL